MANFALNIFSHSYSSSTIFPPFSTSDFSSFKLSKSPHFATSGCRCSWIEESSTSYRNMYVNAKRRSYVYASVPRTSVAVSTVEDLYEFICSGPLLDKVGLSREKIGESIDKWLTCGSQLCRLFELNEFELNNAQKVRIFHYYIPVFLWCENQISQHASTFKDGEDVPPLMIGFSAPQGCGKTTLVFALNFLFYESGRNCATISIDDFYLTAEGQAKLREANAGNRLLEFRGNAGSHDLPLSIETITALSKLTKEGMKMKIPRYDKSAYSGRGDRADPSTWTEVEGPLTFSSANFSPKEHGLKWMASMPIAQYHAVLFEGWMLGFKPLPDEAVKTVDPQLETVNQNLQTYYDAWDKFVKSWIVIKIKDPSCVYQWRLQAEQAMRADGKSTMTDDEVMDFVSRYLPAYKAYLPTLYSEGPSGSDRKRTLVIEIDEGRNPILAN